MMVRDGMAREKSGQKFSYEPDADVFSWEVSKAPIDFAEEAGNIVVHFDRKREPVLVEILEASRFFAAAAKLVRSRARSATKKLVVAVR